MARDTLLAVAAEVDGLLAAGAAAGVGHDQLMRRTIVLRELSAKVPQLAPVAEAVDKLTSAPPKQAPQALLDLLAVTRQIRASLTSAGCEGTPEPFPESGPWQTPLGKDEMTAIFDDPARGVREDGVHRLVEMVEKDKKPGDLRLLTSLIRAMESTNSYSADEVAEKLIPSYGKAVLSRLLSDFNMTGKTTEARRLVAICKTDPESGADVCRKVLTFSPPPAPEEPSDGKKKGKGKEKKAKRDPNAPSEAVVIKALECMPDVGKPGEAEKYGLAILRSEKKDDLRCAAINALRASTSDEVLETLVPLLPAEGYQVFYAVRNALGNLPHKKTTPRLVEEFERRTKELPPPPVKKKGMRGEKKKAYEKAVEERDQQILHARRVVWTLGDRKTGKQSKATLEALIAHSQHQDSDLAGDVIECLAKLFPEEERVIKLLIGLLDDKDESKVGTAISSLEDMKPELREAAVPKLLKMVANKKGDEDLRHDAMQLFPPHMEKYGKQIIAALSAALQEKNFWVRYGVSSAVYEMGPAAAGMVPAYMKLFKAGQDDLEVDDNDFFFKIEPEGKIAIPALTGLLGAKKTTIKSMALDNLAAYGTKAASAAPAVQKLLKDKHVKDEAAQTLKAIQPPTTPTP